MDDKLQLLVETFDENEYRLTNVEDACGDEVYQIFKLAGEVSDGILKYENGNFLSLGGRNYQIIVNYHFTLGEISKNLQLEYRYSHQLDVINICKELNALIRSEGFEGEKYFFELGLDVGMSGIAFSTFSKEKKLYENEVIWRGGKEFSHLDEFDYFWERHQAQEPDKIEHTKTDFPKPWWKFW